MRRSSARFPLGWLLILLALAGAFKSDAASRFSVFRRDPRSFLGMGSGNELFTVNPLGVANLKKALRGLGSVNYATAGGSMTVGFSNGRNPRSMSGKNLGSIAFGKARGGALIAIFKDIRGRRLNAAVMHAPSSSVARSERIGEPSFDLTGFSHFGFTREQVENDVGVFGEQLANLFSSDFSQLELLLQRVINLADAQGVSPKLIPLIQTITNAANGTLSTLPNSKDVLTRPVDLFLDQSQPLATNLATDYTAIINDIFDPSRGTSSYVDIDSTSSGVVSFTEGAASFVESAGKVFIYCSRQSGSSGACTAHVVLEASSGADIAEAGKDFILGVGTINWKAGESGPKAAFFQIIDDKIPENLETFTLRCTDYVGVDGGSQLLLTVGIVDDDGAVNGTQRFGPGRNSEFIVEYLSPPEQKDLDTGTTFLGNTLGFNYPNFETANGLPAVTFAPFMVFTSNDLTGVGPEVVRIDTDGAIADGFIDGSNGLNVQCAADWFKPAHGFGPATIRFYFRDKRTGKIAQPGLLTISPGTSTHTGLNTRATTAVGSAIGTYDPSLDFFVYNISN